MKKIIFVLVVIGLLAINFSVFAEEEILQASIEKIDICHKTTDSWQFMSTPAGESLGGHLGHGDYYYAGPTEGTLAEKDLWCLQNDPKGVSNVTICKQDANQNPLSNWQMILSGEKVGSVDVLPTGANFKILGVPAGNYVVKASGQYVYRPVASAMYSDAAYSKRATSDYLYTLAAADPTQSPFLPWVRENGFLPVMYKGYLGITMNNAYTEWGSAYNPAHIYALGTTTTATSDFSFKIVDNYYLDNSGKITVDMNKGYTGMTGTDGCVTFNQVPYGTYLTDEIMKMGWSNLSGLGSVIVNDPSETFTVINKAN